MDDRQKIQQMVRDRAITPDQGTLLLDALAESEARSRRSLQDISLPRQKREKQVGRFLGG